MSTRILAVLCAILCVVFPKFSLAQSTNSVSAYTLPFTFTLTDSARTSAGVYKTDGTLVRTLWGGVAYGAGTHSEKWDGLDDAAVVVPNGSYQVKVLSNNVKYEWEGVIGNTSTNATGSTVHRSFQFMNAMVITGGKAFTAAHYNEGNPSQYKFNIATPQQKEGVGSLYKGLGQGTQHMCTDDINIYYGGFDPYSTPTGLTFVFAIDATTEVQTIFANGSNYQTVYGPNYPSCLGLSANAGIAGMAVQKSGIYLFISRYSGNIDVFNKTSGALVRTISGVGASRLVCDLSDNLWVQTGVSIQKYGVGADGRLLSLPLAVVTGLVSPRAMAVSPDNNTLVVCDGGISQQVKAFSNSSGLPSWTLGTLGGYSIDPTVNDNKFYFSDFTDAVAVDPLKTFIAFQPDGSFWVGDVGNYRVQHYSSNRTFIDRIMYLPSSYSIAADPNNPTRVFDEYLEFAVDYSLPLAPDNGSWKLVKNWRGTITPQFYHSFMAEILKNVTTLSNGRTYALIKDIGTKRLHVVELPPSGPLRFTGIITDPYNFQIQKDGSLTVYGSGQGIGAAASWYSNDLVGFDPLNNPIWASNTIIQASISPIVGSDPYSWDGGRTGQKTTSGIIVSFDKGNVSTQYGYGNGYHLGGVALGDNKFKWKTAHVTDKDYYGDFPSDGAYDIGNGVQFPGGDVLVIDNNIFWNYHGEFWKSSQTNIFNHVYDNGLMVGQFGTTGPDWQNDPAPPPMMAGNAFSLASVKDANGNIYIYHNDESSHAGVHRWKVSNLNSINQQTKILSFPNDTIPAPVVDAIFLMEGLTYKTTLIDGQYGWQRNPVVNDQTDYGSKWWNVQTGVKSYKKSSLDVYAHFRQNSAVHTVSRELGTNTNLVGWKLSGKVNYEGNYPNEDNASGGSYIEVLDVNDKIISRFYTRHRHISDFSDSMYIQANNQVIARGENRELQKITRHSQPLEIISTAGNVIFKYAKFAPVTSPIFDPTADWTSPKTLRVYFWTNTPLSNYDRIVDLEAMKFTPKRSSKYFRSTKTGNWDNPSAWQFSADGIKWIDTTLVPTIDADGIVIRNNDTITLTGTVSTDQLSITGNSKLIIAPNAELIVNDGIGDDITIANAASLIVRSTASGNGRIGNSSGNINGDVTVERFISSFQNKSFRLLTPSVNTATGIKPFVKDNWQEGNNNSTPTANTNSVANYGIHINGSANGQRGFDASQSGAVSLFTYEPSRAAPGWVAAINTDATTLDAKKAYLVYIGGDRSTPLNVDSTFSASSNTTLRSTGKILSGTQTFVNLQGNLQLSLVTNPYVSPVNWKTLYKDPTTTNAISFENFYTYLDPNVGTNGGYVTVNINGIKSTPTNATVQIQPGQPFFLKAKANVSSPTFTIKESHKSSGPSTDVFRTGPAEQFTAALYYNGADSIRRIADGVTVVFNNDYSSNVDGDDAEEIPNWNENISIKRTDKKLSIEARPLIDITDTLPLLISGLKIKNYEWQFDPERFAHPNLKAFLVDKFLNVKYMIDLASITIIQFSVVEDSASSASDRFKVIFAPIVAALPVTITSIKAYEKGQGIKVEWTTHSEINVDRYEVEKSLDGQTFTKIGRVVSRNLLSIVTYKFFDANPVIGNNYYRIKVIDRSGEVVYTQIVNVNILRGSSDYVIYPNPVVGSTFNLMMQNVDRGEYTINLITASGQQVFTKVISHSGGSATESISLPPAISRGAYKLQVTNGGHSVTMSLLKE